MCEHLQFIELVVEGYRKEYALIDMCIAPIIKDMQDRGIKTISSCCAHGLKEFGYVLDTRWNIYLVKNGEIVRKLPDGKKLYLKEFEKMGRAFESKCRKHYGFGFRYTRPYHPLSQLGNILEKNITLTRRELINYLWKWKC